MKPLLAIYVVVVAAFAHAGCLSEADPPAGPSTVTSAIQTECNAIEEPGDGTVLFCSLDGPRRCCCDHVDMLTGEIFGISCVTNPGAQ